MNIKRLALVALVVAACELGFFCEAVYAREPGVFQKVRTAIGLIFESLRTWNFKGANEALRLAMHGDDQVASLRLGLEKLQSDLAPDEDALYRGLVLWRAGNLPRAKPYLARGVRMKPNDADGYKCRASAFDALEQYEKAIADYNVLIALDPNDSGSYFQRSEDYGQIGQTSLQEVDRAQAERLGLRVISPTGEYIVGSPSPDAEVDNQKTGDVFSSASWSVGDEVTYNKLSAQIKSHPSDPRLFIERAHFALNKHTSLADLNRAIELAPSEPNGYRDRAYVLWLDFHDYRKALRDYDAVLRLRPKDPFAQFDRINMFAALGQFEKALLELDKLKEWKSDWRRAELLSGMRRYKDAIDLYTRMIDREVDGLSDAAKRGDCYLALRQYQKALSDYNATIAFDRLTGTRFDIYLHRARAYIGLGEYAKAIEDCETVMAFKEHTFLTARAARWRAYAQQLMKVQEAKHDPIAQ